MTSGAAASTVLLGDGAASAAIEHCAACRRTRRPRPVVAVLNPGSRAAWKTVMVSERQKTSKPRADAVPARSATASRTAAGLDTTSRTSASTACNGSGAHRHARAAPTNCSTCSMTQPPLPLPSAAYMICSAGNGVSPDSGLSIRSMAHRFDVAAIGVEDERPVGWMASPQSGPVVSSTGRERGFVERPTVARSGLTSDVNRASPHLARSRSRACPLHRAADRSAELHDDRSQRARAPA